MTKTSMLFFPSLLTISTNKSSHKIHKSSKVKDETSRNKETTIFFLKTKNSKK
jgi:hypothetical protein